MTYCISLDGDRIVQDRQGASSYRAADIGRSRQRGDRLNGKCPLLAQSRHGLVHCKCPLLGVKRKWLPDRKISANDQSAAIRPTSRVSQFDSY
jgi:hypothetical protein